MRLSVIIPTRDEAADIAATLAPLQSLRRAGVELLVVDGGSRDETIRIATPLATRIIAAARGRAAQMNAGARAATGDCLLFLHADTRLPATALEDIQRRFELGRVWGHFAVKLSGTHPLFRLVETLMNWRSALSGIATGDQAIFVRRAEFERIGGFPDLPLMEDIVLSKRLRRIAWPVRLHSAVVTSSRRWEKNGVWRTIFLMWWLRLKFFFGADPASLARHYDPDD